MSLNMKKLFSTNKEKGKKLFMSIISLLVVVGIGGLLYYQLTSKSIEMKIDGETKIVRTHAETVNELMMDVGIKVDRHDYLSHELDEPLKHGMIVRFKDAKEVTVTANGQDKKVHTTAKNVGDLMKEHSIAVTDHDFIKPGVKTNIKDKMTITFNQAFEVTLNNAGTETKVMTTTKTVKELLEAHDITLGELDRVEPALDTALTGATAVNVVRVEKATETVEEKLPFAVVKKQDSTLNEGQEKVVSEGREGLAKKTVEITRENGQEVSRNVIETITTEEAQDKIIAVGSKKQSAFEGSVAVSRGGNSEPAGGKEFYVSSTAYSENCTNCSGVTATGFNLKANPNAKVIAVDPSIIPLGSKVYVEGYGYAMALDTGGAIKGNRIDVFFSSEQQAKSWGRKTVKIKVIE
ncbi:ubiquitin-like domain-containing protein [Massilibacterium senegalense]|uniref:ubiquitin-like domain-containing protein n=1 Tax=Massilibacterium senegalense TaxID=1632858 RepID=UPI000780B83A|nr:G5 and 3D domain-containing protein [Massilibacterium senegalense]